MQYQLNLGIWNGVFIVPNAVVDQHLKLAGAAQLKTLLWMLRCAGQNCDLGQIAAATGLSQDDALDAIEYWIRAGLIKKDSDGLMFPSFASQSSSIPDAVTEEKEKPQAVLVVRSKPDNREVARRLSESREINELLVMSQNLMRKLLSPSERSTLVWLYDDMGVSADVILMAIEYCQSLDKCSIGYLEKVVLTWLEEGVDSHEKAEQYIKVLKSKRENENIIISSFGQGGRALSANERKYIDRWICDWNFNVGMIKLAYDRTVDKTGKLSFSYINSILKSWHEKGIRTLRQAAEENGTRPETNRESSFDLKKYEDMALLTSFEPDKEEN